ncbi:hypothetical protein DLAC_07384 [Tieghemostelium lacteum]|uniref:C2 domain-containing protein n=1 Tax=Tieghemostelium lacteum TaxID=361077 RepID=A0A151ZCG4_TIELA|nr:hypothetical protein DLAC_07384 [Tieghemostelium lacteum]|eukprot:KYQ91615.1 hypothetical protein DLAC_07384 [Tieghemostelium lacteum]
MSVYQSKAVRKALGYQEPKEKKESGRKADPKKHDIMIVQIISGKVNEATDPNGLSDPYVRIGKAENDSIFASRWLCETPVQEKTLSPTWNFEEEVIVNKKLTKLVLELWDKDTFRNDFIGRAYIDISKVTDLIRVQETIKVYKDEEKTKETGSVYVNINKLRLGGAF